MPFIDLDNIIYKLNSYDLNFDSITISNQSGLAYYIIDPRGDYLIFASIPGVNQLETFPYFY